MNTLFNDENQLSADFLTRIFECCEPSVLASLSLCCKRYQFLAFTQLKSSDTQLRLERTLKEEALLFYVLAGRLVAFPQDRTLMRHPERLYCMVPPKSTFFSFVSDILRASPVDSIA